VEYHYGRAHATYYMGTEYARAGLLDVASELLRSAEARFARLGHSAGLDWCRQAKGRYRVRWDGVDASEYAAAERSAGLQVWRSVDWPEIVLEVLNVDSFPQEPVSKLKEWSAKQIDKERRETCVPVGMDPYFRCMLYAAGLPARPADAVFQQLAGARRRLESQFNAITELPGAEVQGEWALWRRKRVAAEKSPTD